MGSTWNEGKTLDVIGLVPDPGGEGPRTAVGSDPVSWTTIVS